MVHFVFGKKDGKLFLTARGHAGTAEYGKDLVCAAATMLAYTLAQSACVLNAEGKLIDEPTINIASGDADISFTPSAGHEAEAETTMKVIENGAQCLSGVYPDNVQVHYIGYGD